ncbi:small, acid-soluble spore protein, alpha/beta type [Desulfosporosinus fructosivorans]|uniref:Small, acid-soluble spore protein, alpha/beta type n=1 Tax=Desulfosporosinus fructosivorans TaxID=2018669 RepID=A0A4Z0RAB8_9FIRM|nr:small, acid-soluble spore protein, alpha/beta type [Desulfosporosinus fructosivorans]TGE40142.1 small, acid-soluble spore protein, alpha/beta type [Desulfosporosinus fructosivorans]
MNPWQDLPGMLVSKQSNNITRLKQRIFLLGSSEVGLLPLQIISEEVEALAKTSKPMIQLTPELEKFKYEVAQEIGIANRKHKSFPNTPQK